MAKLRPGYGRGHMPLENLSPQKPDDWLLVERIKAGDDRAFDEIMARYKRPILDFIYRMIGDAVEAEDAAQDVFARAWRGILKPDFRRNQGKFSTWLFQVARNAALDRLRRRKRHPAESLSALEDRGEFASSAGPTSADEAEAREIGELIAAAVALLPEDQRAAIVLSEYGNLSYSEIASIMKRSVKSVEARLYRARRFLRSRLAHLVE